MFRLRPTVSVAASVIVLSLAIPACSSVADAAGTDDLAHEGGTDSTCDARPGDGLYAPCSGASDCGAGFICATPTGVDPAVGPAYCTEYCTADFECPAVGECTAMPICLIPNSGGTGVCALDCSDDLQCPDGMECVEDQSGGFSDFLCF